MDPKTAAKEKGAASRSAVSASTRTAVPAASSSVTTLQTVPRKPHAASQLRHFLATPRASPRECSAEQAVALELSIERRARHVERPACVAHVPARGFERPLDRLALVVLELHARARLAATHRGAEIEISRVDHSVRTHDERASEHVLELAHVAGPRVPRECGERARREARSLVAGMIPRETLEQRFGQKRQV